MALVIIFRVLPLLTLVAFVTGIVLIARGTMRGNGRQRAAGMGCVALFVVLLVTFVLLGLAQL